MTALLRSNRWFVGDDLNTFIHRAWLRSQGHSPEMFDGRPVVGIVNSWSEATPCNAHLRHLADHVRRGVLRVGGFPLEVPVMSLGEVLMKPTTMLYRNLAAIEVEETIRSLPLDAVVTLSGCDKTTAAMLLGVASTDVPALVFTGGPMLRGVSGMQEWPGATGVWRADRLRRTGKMSDAEWSELEECVARSAGHCGVMGTASTMAAMVEALGLTLPGAAAVPAVDARRQGLAEQAGAQAVALALAPRTPAEILSPGAFHNAIVTLMALGGSTNAVIHLLALARRVGVPLDLDVFDSLSRMTPVLADVVPTGGYQMEDFFHAGGVPGVLHELLPLLDDTAMSVIGETLVALASRSSVIDRRVIRPLEEPISSEGGLAVLRGSLCPEGAVIKHAAASPELLHHRGRAVVFDGRRDLARRINDPDLRIDPSSVLVLRYGGPVGGPGMPEWGMLPIPDRLLQAGVEDMVRISDARMSGTSGGTCVLHVSPEAAVGGPLAVVEDGDEIGLDLTRRTLDLHVDEREIARRLARWTPPTPAFERGYGRLYLSHVTQAHDGADLDVLSGSTSTDHPAYDPETY